MNSLFLEDFGVLVWWLILMVMSVNAVFMFFVFYRRLSRARYFAEKDAARERYSSPAQQFAAGELPVEQAADVFGSASSQAEIDTIEELLRARVNPVNLNATSELFFALGYVERWASVTFGRRTKQLVKRSMQREQAAVDIKPPKVPWWKQYEKLRIFAVPRALNLEHLGRLAPAYAEVFLAEGLHDSSGFVRRVAIEHLGRNRYPQAVPLLLEELRRAVEEGNDVSLRSMKAALIGYQIEDLDLFIPYLSHPAKRVRFFVIDTLREICQRAAGGGLLAKNDFSPGLCRLILEVVTHDEFADVRARSAWVVRHFRDAAAKESLTRLMRDENEFVRLHAVRACGHRAYTDLVKEVVTRLTDSRWRVREAAVGSLAKFGPTGLDELYRYFVTCPDAFACEQITEEIQRKGLVDDLVTSLGNSVEEAALARGVVQKMAMMGKTSLLIDALAVSNQAEARISLMESLASSPNDELLAVLVMIAQSSSGQVKSKASQILHQSSSNIQMKSASGAS
jgi:HEAT repeat protein